MSQVPSTPVEFQQYFWHLKTISVKNTNKMIGKKIIEVAKAIADHEGWTPPNERNKDYNSGSIAYRHNNPGNLRYSSFQAGQKNGFAYFFNEDIGWMALMYDIWKKCNGNTSTKLGPKSTLADLITIWAPPSENDTENYISVVERKTGINRKTLLEKLLEE